MNLSWEITGCNSSNVPGVNFLPPSLPLLTLQGVSPDESEHVWTWASPLNEEFEESHLSQTRLGETLDCVLHQEADGLCVVCCLWCSKPVQCVWRNSGPEMSWGSARAHMHFTRSEFSHIFADKYIVCTHEADICERRLTPHSDIEKQIPQSNSISNSRHLFTQIGCSVFSVNIFSIRSECYIQKHYLNVDQGNS